LSHRLPDRFNTHTSYEGWFLIAQERSKFCEFFIFSDRCWPDFADYTTFIGI